MMHRFPSTMTGRRWAAGMGALLLGALTTAQAGPGEPESTPVSVITAIASGDDGARALAVQPDGRIVVAGYAADGFAADMVLARYTPDGSLDQEFGGDGIVSTGGAGDDRATAVAVQPDGKILVGGYLYIGTDYRYAVARYDAAGNPDTGFGTDGVATYATGGHYDFGMALALQPDGRILLAGASMDGASYSAALLRFNADGSLDTGFGGGDGVVLTAMAPGWSGSAEAIALQPDGAIVVAGTLQLSSMTPESDLLLMRHLPDGTPDPAFGPAGGMVTLRVDTLSSGRAVAVQPDGMILVAGTASSYDPVVPATSTAGALVVARFRPDGTLDTGFDGDGVASVTEGPQTAGHCLALQPDGRIVAAGTDGTALLVARFDADGGLDTGFGGSGNGRAALLAGDSAGARAIGVQPDGTLLAAGYVSVGGAEDFHLRRLLANDANDDGVAEPWDLVPDPFHFTDTTAVAAGGSATSDTVAISGLQSGTRVLARALCDGGDCGIALNDATGFQPLVWVTNGDRIRVRHTAADATVHTLVVVGGLSQPHSPSLAFAEADTASDTFTSTPPGAGGGDGGGGGALGGEGLLLLLWWAAQRRHLNKQ